MQYGMGCADCDTMRLGLGYLRSGMGDDGSGDDPIIDVTPPEPPSTTPPLVTSDCAFGGVYPNCSANPFASPTVTSTPLTTASGAPVSSGNAALDTALANIAAQWTKIAGQTIAPQTTIVGPNGLQLTTPAGQTSNLAGVLASAGVLTSSGSISPYVIFGGLAIAGFLLLKK
jgi:hypothetical protein